MRTSKSASLPLAGGGAVRRIVRRNLTAFLGLAVLALAAAVAASLATWTIDDPSLSHATDRAVRNVLGFPGAILADLLTQFLGLAPSVLLLPPVIWGWRAVFATPSRFGWQTFLTWLAGTLAATLALAAVPPPPTWPLPTGLGGLAGDVLLDLAAWLLGATPRGLSLVGVGGLAAVLAFVSILHACGLILWREAAAGPAPRSRAARPVFEEEDFDDDEDDFAALDEDDDDDERPRRLSLLLGALAHVTLTAVGGLRRLLGRRGRRSTRAMLAARDFDGMRLEPTLGWRDADGEDDDAFAEPVPARRGAAPAAAPRPKRRRPRRALAGAGGFELPPLELLSEPRAQDRKAGMSPATLEQNARLLEGVLDDFGVRGEIVNVHPGPVVALYELEPAPGIKTARVIGLADDIARSMSAISCRVAVIPGKNAIGIELPNPRRETVYLRELLASEDFADTKARLGLCLGKTIGGEPVIVDLARMPHLLVAGTTGSGKSVSINAMILSLLYRMTPEECRVIMIDPKMLELSTYEGIPHLLTPVVTDPKQAVVALKWTVREMEDRYRKMSKLGVRNVDGYNARLNDALSRGEELTRTVQTGFDRETGEPIYEKEHLSLDPMPYIVVIIDEMADLMMVAGKDIEGAVQRLAQMARAAGIHVVMATQRPSVDVITGTIKANFPTRISFQVTSKIDSRTILGEQGAEQLLGQGDMLYMAGGGRIQRIHGPFVSEEEVEEVVAHLKEQGAPDYLYAVTAGDDDGEADVDALSGGGEESNDLYDRAVAVVLRDRKASTSYIQRRLQIGYNRAASIIERMEEEGVVGPANHAGKRDILVGEDEDGGYR
jgi:S-DNA-T family DNA segregation ATPase FtsK/SpoIIIE